MQLVNHLARGRLPFWDVDFLGGDHRHASFRPGVGQRSSHAAARLDDRRPTPPLRVGAGQRLLRRRRHRRPNLRRARLGQYGAARRRQDRHFRRSRLLARGAGARPGRAPQGDHGLHPALGRHRCLLCRQRAQKTRRSDRKKVGTSPGSSSTVLFGAMLKASGIPDGKVDIINLDSTAKIAALLQHRVDAITGPDERRMCTGEAQEAEEKITCMPVANFGVNAIGAGLIVNDDPIKQIRTSSAVSCGRV